MSTSNKKLDVLVIGGGPAGMLAALRAGDLGAKTALVTRDDFGGMAANEVATVLDVSVATVERDLKFGRAWLKQALTR